MEHTAHDHAICVNKSIDTHDHHSISDGFESCAAYAARMESGAQISDKTYGSTCHVGCHHDTHAVHTKGLSDIQSLKQSVSDLTQRHEKKMHQLWTAMGRFQDGGRDARAWGDDGADGMALRGFLRNGMHTKALSTQDESGGFLMSRPVQQYINDQVVLHGGVRSLAQQTSISTDALEFLIDANTADVGWASEVGDRDETKTPELRKHTITVHEMYAKPKISQKMLDDASVHVESWLIEKVAHKMHQQENHAFIHGDGVGKPRGILNYPVVSVGSGTVDAIESVFTGIDGGIADIHVLYQAIEAMRPELLDGAVWYVARSVITQLRCLRTRDGLPIWQPSLLAKEPNLLLGYPVVVTDDLPALRTGEVSTSMLLANFKRGYHVVDRHDMRVLRDPYSAKPFVEFYVTKRVGGDVVNTDAFKAIRFAAA